jgi:hypothetical protein
MTTPEQAQVNNYDLQLPPLTTPMEGDAPIVWELAKPEVRTGLEEANRTITEHYRSLEADGRKVHELIRGVTPKGACVAIAEHAPEDTTKVVKNADFSRDRPVFYGDDRTYEVFIYGTGEVTAPGIAESLRPLPVLDVIRTRAGVEIVSVQAPDGRLDIDVPLTSDVYSPGWKIDDDPVTSFQMAAFGERRRAIVREALKPLSEAQYAAWRASREANRGGDEAKEARFATESRELTRRFNEAYARLLAQPELVDTPGAILDPWLAERVDGARAAGANDPELFWLKLEYKRDPLAEWR